MNNHILNKRVKIVYNLIIILILIFLIKVLYISLTKEPKDKTLTIKDRALRGSIISSEGYTISRSIKSYSISIHTKYLDPNKKDFFFKLLSIYTDIPKEELEAKIYTKDGKLKNGWVILADNIDAKRAIYLKELKYKLNRFKVFVPKGINKNFYYGLTISEIGESREYPLKEALSPILGYTRTISKDNYKYIVGYNGIEKFYNKYLNYKQDGLISGHRDAVGYIIQDAKTKYIKRVDGYSLVLNISLGLQKNIDLILDDLKVKLGAKEIIAAVMQSSNSKLLAITSSNRYDPLNIKADEIANLQPKATTYAYEPGSVLKPISLSIVLEKNATSIDEIIPTYNGKMWIGRHRITDDEPAYELSVQDVIIKSSNIGISQIVWKIKPKEFREGLLKFGLGRQKSGIDIGKEALGKIYSLKKMRAKINRATTSYGYGIQATFAQLLKAYNVFNNDGVSLSPRAVNYLLRDDGKKFFLKKDFTIIKPISKDVANSIKQILIKNVEYGTGVAAKTEGLEVGGKTGTAMISSGGKYEKRYHTSFFGFANDSKGNRYTIGVLVIEPDYAHHFASQSAAVVFKKIVDAMIDRGLLKPNLSEIQKRKKEQEAKIKEQMLNRKREDEAKKVKEKLRKQRIKIKKEVKHKQKIKKIPVRQTAPVEPDLF